MVTATPLSSRGGDLMGIGDRAQLHTFVQSNLYFRTGLSSDCDSSHPISLNVFLSSVRGTIEPWSQKMGIVVAPALSLQLLYSLSLSSKTSLGLSSSSLSPF